MGLNDAAFLGASAPLGIVTKKYVTPPSVELHQGDLLDTSTGEILTRTLRSPVLNAGLSSLW